MRRDKKRFDDILKGKVRDNFKRYIRQPEVIIQKGNEAYALPFPKIELPRFTLGENQGGVGQGPGDKGDGLNSNPDDTREKHLLELEVAPEELAAMLREELELPRLMNKGKDHLKTTSERYNNIAKIGPRSLVHVKRSIKEGMKRMIATGNYTPGTSIPLEPRDFRYRAAKQIVFPDPRAVIIDTMDVSGSMDDEKKRLVRTTAFWTDVYFDSEYKGLVRRYIVHDAHAWEVDKESFYRLRTAGGTKISSALELSDKIIEDEHPPSDWNIYLFQYSDGDNWDRSDTQKALERLEKMLPHINQYAYGEVKGTKDNGFKNALKDYFGNHPKIVLGDINTRDDCLEALKLFLGKGN